MPKLMKSCLNLSKLWPKYCRSLFPDTVYILITIYAAFWGHLFAFVFQALDNLGRRGRCRRCVVSSYPSIVTTCNGRVLNQRPDSIPRRSFFTSKQVCPHSFSTVRTAQTVPRSVRTNTSDGYWPRLFNMFIFICGHNCNCFM